ncbi:hexosyltransferase [Neoasaia chiangmaiensis NBRC 101099]|uniref:Hexosyltransferase n=1 Tax=Neoasaia chiangmaiensis TaxID=320497 RepID=A0A1U9KM23_9PROT|nr:glycosyltransferase family 4 protein [Neoasaia chiangmaiensis]AQS86843.1 hexosyltransferase [Neoasaia chiangmaiensis]GBR37360.1 hexosyltransferase [Neoasaia chiangmaiensis NBRC 101099]GEN14915.1 hypothetical protein NCH01_13460 [Neoasaia chiangmaiensis]
MRVLTVLPRREGYAFDRAGAIALLVSRLADADDAVLGCPVDGDPLPGGRFVPIEEVGAPWSWLSENMRYQVACQRAIRRLRPDLIEVHNKPALAAALSRQAKVHLILHNDPQDMRGARSPGQRADLLKRVRVITVSDWVRKRYLDDLDDAPVTVMPNCLDLSALPPRLTQRKPTVLFVGRMVADKGADAFVRAWASVAGHAPDWKAVMIGADRFRFNSPRTTFIDRVEAQADAVGIIHTGYQTHAQVLAAMAEAAIVVVPSRWPEPFGLTALEAMASGAAVISSPYGGLPETVGDAALRARPDVAGELESAMLRLIGNDAEREELSRLGLERARGFDVPAARQRLMTLRRQTVSGDLGI